jgi:Uma2 family endonuclease
MQAAVSAEFHGAPDNRIQTWLGTYAAHVEGVHAFTNSTARCDDQNAPQPDGALCLDARCGGRSRLDERGFLLGAPELVAEIAASSASYDLFDKLEVYEEFGVEEYIVWLAHEGEIRWFRRDAGKLQSQPLGADGVFRSEVFSGLWLDAAAMVRGEMRRVLSFLHEGLASPAHVEFAQSLRNRTSNTEAT